MQEVIQLYTLRDHSNAPVDNIKLASEAGFDAVELADLPEEDEVDELSRVLEMCDLDVAGAHIDIELLESDPDVVADRLGELGCDHAVIPYLPDEAFASATEVDKTARRLTTISETLAEFDVDLSYHNHDHEFQSIQSLDQGTSGSDSVEPAFDRLLRETENHVGVELDLGWVVAAGADPVDLLRRISGRAELVHFKDTDEGVPVGLGNGDVNLERCVDAVRETDATWAIYEHDQPSRPAKAAREGYTTLTALLSSATSP